MALRWLLPYPLFLVLPPKGLKQTCLLTRDLRRSLRIPMMSSLWTHEFLILIRLVMMMSRESRPWVCILYLYYVLFFFSSCHFLVHPSIYSAYCSCHTVIDILEEFKTTASPTMPIVPIPVVPTALTPAGHGNFLTLIPSSIKTFVIAPISFLRFLFRGLYCALYSFSGPSCKDVCP